MNHCIFDNQVKISTFVILFRVKKCKISNGSSEIHPIHSFGDDVCFDSKRKSI